MANNFDVFQAAVDLWQEFDDANLSLVVPEELKNNAVRCKVVGYDTWSMQTFFKIFKEGTYRSLSLSQNEPQPEVIIGIFGERDMSKANQESLEGYKQAYGAFFPIIVFPDSYFEIPYHEAWGYVPHIEDLSNKAKYPALPLKAGDFIRNPSIFAEYADKIALTARLFRARAAAIKWRKLMKTVTVPSLPQLTSPCNTYLHKVFENKMWEAKERLHLIDSILIEKLHQKVITSYREATEQIIHNAQVKKYHLKEVPSQLKGHGLEALVLAQKIESLIKLIKSHDHLSESFLRQLDALKHYLAFATDVSLIGTFSAGKTTFVNALLGLKLKTSSNHNTAVLTSVEYVPKEQPSKLYFNYFSNHHFRLFSPDYDHPKLALYSPCRGKIIDIHYNNNQFIIILVDEEDNDRIIPLSIGTQRELIPRLLKYYRDGFFKTKNLKIEKNTILTEGITIKQLTGKKHNFSRFFCMGKFEIEELVRQIRKGTFGKLELLLYQYNEEVLTITESKLIITHLLSFTAIASEKPSARTFPLEEINEKYPLSQYYQAELFATLDPDHSLPLTVSIENEQRLHQLEAPSCYLFVERTRFTQHNPYLQLANIIDTPGLGSVTSRHDLITERHLRETEGIMILLIKIHLSIETLEFWNLLTLLRYLFMYGKRSADHLMFLCNWQEGFYTPEDGKEKIKQVAGYLRSFGFSTDQFYVGDLDALGRYGAAPETFMGYPSLATFREDLSRKTTRLGSGAKLKLLQSDLDGLLQSQYAQDQQALRNIREGNEYIDLASILDDYSTQQQAIEKIGLDKSIRYTEERLLSDTLRDCRYIINNVSTGDDWDGAKKRLVSLAEELNEAFNAPTYFSHITAKANQIKSVGDWLDQKVEISISSHQFGTARQISIVSFENQIKNAKEAWPSRWGRIVKWFQGDQKTTLDGLRRKVSSFIEDEINRIEKSYKQRADAGEKWFESNRADAVNTIKGNINTLKTGHEDEIDELQNRAIFFEEEVMPLWEKLSKQIDQLNVL
jgi:hypothetical protein